MDNWFYRTLLRVYPRPFREKFESRMLELFSYRREQARARGGMLWPVSFWGYVIYDLFRSAWAEHAGKNSIANFDSLDDISRGGGSMDHWIRDISYSARRLARSPGFTFASVLILALAIGVNTAAFSVVNTLLFKPPPFEDNDQVVEVLQDNDSGDPNSTSYPAFLDIVEYRNVFSEVGARLFGDVPFELPDGDLIPAPVEYATSTYLSVLGLSPILGRWFDSTEENLDGPPSALLTHRLWLNTLNADPDIVGRVIRLNGASVTVVGVGPAGYQGGIGFATASLWLSISAMDDTSGPARSMTRREDHPVRVAARLAPGVTPEAAQLAMDELASRLSTEFPDLNRNRGIHVVQFYVAGAESRGSLFPMAGLIMGLVGLVLLVASVNLANLILVRGMSREREIGVRMALGGTRSRLIRTIYGETALLTLAGAGGGLLLTYMLMSWLGKLNLGIGGQTNLEIKLDLTVLAFTILLTVAASLIGGLLPALRLISPSAEKLVRKRQGQGPGKSRLAGTLVSIQVAGSLILLVAAGLVIDAAVRASTASPGFNTENVAFVQLDLSALGIPPEGALATFQAIQERVVTLPGVAAASFARNLPARRSGTTTLLVGDLEDGRRKPVEVRWNVVRDGYFTLMEIPLIHGQVFDERVETTPGGVVVNRAMAEAFWGHSDVVGETYAPENAPDEPVEIVGVVETTKVGSLDEPPTPLVYFNGQRSGSARTNLFVRADGPASSVLPAVRQVVRDQDARILTINAATMESYLSSTLGSQRLTARILFAVGLFALGLAAFGIYGVVSFNVSRRIPEVGIRMTLGAKRSSVIQLFIRETGILVGIGGAIGLGIAIALIRLIGAEFFGVEGLPTLVLLACTATLAIAAVLATGLPARKAAYLDPAQTLKQE